MATTIGQQIINLGPQDLNISVSAVLPGANSNVTTAILDLQAIAPNSDAWRLGRLAVVVPAIPENLAGAGISISLQAAPPSLTGGSSAVAPLQPGPGAFITPICSQTITIAPVAASGSAPIIAYFNLASDANGSTMEFYQFLITTPSGTVPNGENIVIAWTPA